MNVKPIAKIEATFSDCQINEDFFNSWLNEMANPSYTMTYPIKEKFWRWVEYTGKYRMIDETHEGNSIRVNMEEVESPIKRNLGLWKSLKLSFQNRWTSYKSNYAIKEQ